MVTQLMSFDICAVLAVLVQTVLVETCQAADE